MPTSIRFSCSALSVAISHALLMPISQAAVISIQTKSDSASTPACTLRDAITSINNGASRVLNIQAANVSLSSLTLTGGSISGNAGGLFASDSADQLQVRSETITGNSATGTGGGRALKRIL